MPGLSIVDDASRPGRREMTPRTAQPRRAGAIAFLCAALAVLATGPTAAAVRTWTGAGDGFTWGNASNWNDGTVPANSDEVVLDHSSVASAYNVLLPADESMITVRRLTLGPAGGAEIRLTLSSDNTANPGLRVGDGVAGTDDIVIQSGGVLQNSSGALFGNGIEVQSLANGTMRIENGGRYIHGTLRSASGTAPNLSLAAGTERGEFEYDVPGAQISNIAASARTYGTLILSRSSGPASYGALGSQPLTVRGDLVVGTGVTFTSSMTGACVLQGNMIQNGAAVTFSGSQSVRFSGSALQTLSGSGDLTIPGSAAI